LSPLIIEFKGKIEILLNEKIDNRYHLNFEYSILESEGEPSKIIGMFFEAIENLSPDGKEVFDGCEKKVIDIGYNSGAEGWQYSVLPNVVIKKIADEGFQLNISIYGIEPHVGKSEIV
jgi:hypothetical protein